MSTYSVTNLKVSLPSLATQDTENLGPGCYVRVHDASGCFWVEITHVDGDTFVGRVHKELETPNCPNSSRPANAKAVFSRHQIVDLGCDNYCWC